MPLEDSSKIVKYRTNYPAPTSPSSSNFFVSAERRPLQLLAAQQHFPAAGACSPKAQRFVSLNPDQIGQTQNWTSLNGKVTHRSISPITMSSEPTIAGTSAIRQPRHRSCVTDKLQNELLRARTRDGIAPLPLLTM